ncbi:hypothetical protein MOK15_21335 [Sphingobium sp. BYY-5]|uniref:hypothetical protein n=1 Tax=Sphingobium sp. BYY-5 TaxID=2926400 RepID=UPI001FA72E66|nr:hypothetical protein [Sphingobium sp. BYY-5]MCI4592604.1 hypothetical protein [Sphingobium sp. BYY-5]
MEPTMATTHSRELAAFGIEALAGPAYEIRERLKTADGDQIVALKFEHGNKKYAQAFAEAVRLIAPLIAGKLADREQATLSKLVDALVPQIPLPEHLLAEARMNAEARKAVLESGDWLTAARLSEIAGFSGRNASAQPNKWKREKRIFALRHNGSDYYPGYALDPEVHYRPLKGLMPILERFNGELDDWDMAIWFASANSFLGGKAPKYLLARAPERVLAAAEDEVVGVMHG